ncbi:hypothetical protein Mapa_010791 [Marchantia paleacea]|nr:hypothetical protein Mapa_010791 [Marchantia paleacea]
MNAQPPQNIMRTKALKHDSEPWSLGLARGENLPSTGLHFVRNRAVASQGNLVISASGCSKLKHTHIRGFRPGW